MFYKFAKSLLRTAAIAFPALFAAGAASAATVDLTAARMTAKLPDGTTVPMWGYCQPTATAACVTDGTAKWAPGPTIVVQADATTHLGSLTVNFTNQLPTATSLVILGQLGGGMGTGGSGTDVPRVASPIHSGQPATTWPAVDNSVVFTPPTQGSRARAFGPEVTKNGGVTTYTWTALRPGTYLYETGSVPSLQAPMGLYGVLIVTQSPTATDAGIAYPGVNYDADATLLFSEIDPRQNAAVDAAGLVDADPTVLFSDASCTATAPCYPPAVNYAPTYFLINGQPYDPSTPQNSAFGTSDNKVLANGGQMLVRFVNAGLRTHVPSIVGLPNAGTMNLVAEDGNVAPGRHKAQTHLLLAAGKTFDVLVNPTNSNGTYAPASFPVFDRSLALTSGRLDSGSVTINSGMLGYLAVQSAAATQSGTGGAPVPAAMQPVANPDVYAVAPGASINGNVLANDVNVVNAALGTGPAAGAGTLIFNTDGTFTFTAGASTGTVTFTYTVNNGVLVNGSPVTGTVTINVGGTNVSPPVAVADTFASKVSSFFKTPAPGVLGNDTSATNLVLTPQLDGTSGCTVTLGTDGAVTAVPVSKGGACTFTYHVVDTMGNASNTVTSTVVFPAGSGLALTVQDTQDPTITLDDYSWVIEEDQTFFHDPANPSATNTLAVNFHRSYMPVIASGCTGPISCGTGNTGDPTKIVVRTPTLPSDVQLDPTKRYYVSILPGDADQGDAQYAADGTVQVNAIGHTMGGVNIPPGAAAATVMVPRNPLPPSQLSVIVFEDNNPTNGGVDDGEQGLGGFTINLYDTRGSSGDPAGLMTYDLAGMPFTNSLANQIDSATGTNLCPQPTGPTNFSGTIITCPELDSKGNPSPLAGMALIKNINPGRYDVWATPGADRAIKGETWIQVSTLEGTPANDTFVKPGEPAYWQEFGPPGFHSFIGFVNPDHIKKTNAALGGTATITGRVPSLHMDRPTTITAQGLNNSCATFDPANPSAPRDPTDTSCRATLAQTTCYVSVNSSSGTGANVAMATCDENGNFKLDNVPVGSHSLVIWDQWLDQIIAQKAVNVPVAGQAVDAGDIPVFSWFTRIQQSAYIDLNGNGVRDPGEPGVAQIPMNIRFRDGSISNFLTTDSTGSVTANELFPLFNWYVIESDTTRYTGTGVHTVYDSGGKPDAAKINVTDLNGNPVEKDFRGLLNSTESVSLPGKFQVNGAQYTAGKTSRIDPGSTLTEGTQGFINQTTYVDWGKRPYVPGENGGVTGLVYYASTRGFDDPSLEVQFSWEPAIPRVKVNLYLETTNADGTSGRTLVDTTTTWSWDDAAASLHCPGDPLNDGFVAVTLDANTTPDNQFKCYDGQHAFNQIQPTVYDGRYKFPTASCSICVRNPANDLPNKPASVTYPPVLPVGKYVVELVVPDGYEIVKEEDKNILIGDSWIAPQATQFLGVGNLFIVPDQATLNDANVPGGNLMSAFPPCVGALHRVPDFLTLFPDSGQVSPYAGQDRPLCDHKEVQVTDQGQGGADFQLFTQTPVAGHISGIMLNDAAAEFDPYNPAFLEKASLPNAPISVRDYNGVEIQRVYNDKWGTFNNLVPSTWEANVPNPSGYAPNMLTFCMNDPGPITDTRATINGVANPTYGQQITDPMYNPAFSNFCYVWPAMPGITTYLDTPVLPVSAYASASHYNPVDCAYPTGTPSIFRVDGTEVGPYIDTSKGAATLTIKSLGDVDVPNPAYMGPQVVAPASAVQPKVTRHYGFGDTQGKGSVTIGGQPVSVTSWSNTQIQVSVPATGVPTGELAITTDAGLTSIDTVTVTIENAAAPGYRKPVHVSPAPPSAAGTLAHPIQTAINTAQPGDLIILDAGSYPELVIMDRPIRLQGVGAAATIINATKYPNGKMDDWRTRINNLFGLDNQGNTIAGTPAVDPLPGQEITGGVLLLEPSVLSTEEGPGITVVAKGYEADGTTLLNSSTSPASTRPNRPAGDCNVNNPLRLHNFKCAASRIDGLSVTGGDAGGGIYVNGWAHNLEISNNRVYGNAGPLSGGVRIGQPYLEGQAITGRNFQGFGYDQNVKIHHNSITSNGTVEGNAAAGAVAAAAGGAGGGLSICAGSDGYRVTGNWICGNYSSSDGGGVGHIGLSNNGLIQGNKILFNESFNQTGTQSGGGLVIEGEGAAGTTVSLGTGNVTVDRNLILGNFARAGSGGGIRLASVNGGELRAGYTWAVTVTNNIVTNNLAAWAGAGISLSDTLFSSIVNNTVVANDSTGIAGNLFNTQVGASNTGAVTAVPGPAGISSEPTTPQLIAALPRNQRAANAISKPNLVNNILWHNRSFFFSMKAGTAQLIPSNDWADAVAQTLPAPLSAPVAGANGCVPGTTPGSEKYWDVGVIGETNATTTAFPAGTANVLSTTAGSPNLVKPYCNASSAVPGLQFEPGTPFQPPFNIAVAATLDESGNFVDLHFGPLSLRDEATGLVANGDYHLDLASAGTSNAVDKGVANSAPAFDYDGESRPQGPAFDIGADELALPPAVALVQPTSLTFADHAINTPATAQSLTVTITNVGPAASQLVLSNIAIGGTNANQFSQTNNCTIGGAGLAANASCTVTVKFSPTSTGLKAATLTFTDNAGNAAGTTQVVTLSGRGFVPQALGVITPNPVVMPSMPVNQTSAQVAVTVSNTGTAPLLVTGVTLVGANPTQFNVASTTCLPTGTGVAPGGSCIVNLTFRPTSGGLKTATLRVTDNSGGVTGTQQQATVTGAGLVPVAIVTPNALAFGNVTRNTVSASQTVTVSNALGGAPLTISSIGFSAGGTQFRVTGGTCATGAANAVPAGSSCTVTVAFAPTSAGGKTGTLQISDNSLGNNANQNVSLSGTGL